MSSRSSLRPLTEEKVLTSKALKLIKINKFVIDTTVANWDYGRRMKRFKEKSSSIFKTYLLSRRRGQKIRLKRWYPSTKIHGATSQKNFLSDVLKAAVNCKACSNGMKNGGLQPKTQKMNLHHNTRKKRINISLPKDDFRITASWRLKKIFKVPALKFHEGTARNKILGLYILPPRLKRNRLLRFPTKLPYRAAVRCGSADWDALMVHVWWCSATFSSCISGILKQRISVTIDGTT